MMHPQPIDEFWACSRSLVKDFPLHFKNEKAEHEPLFFGSPGPIVRVIGPALFSNHLQEYLLKKLTNSQLILLSFYILVDNMGPILFEIIPPLCFLQGLRSEN